MKKVWENPRVNSLDLKFTQAGNIIATRQEINTFGFGASDIWRWECKCCGATSNYQYKTEEEAIKAGKMEHGDPCPKSAEIGCSA